MPVRYLKNPDPDGPELALCTRHEFDSMAAALAEKVALRRADLPMPLEVAEMIGRGVSPIQAVREWRGITRFKLSTLSGVHKTTITAIEAGDRVIPRESMRVALARALDCPPAWFG